MIMNQLLPFVLVALVAGPEEPAPEGRAVSALARLEFRPQDLEVGDPQDPTPAPHAFGEKGSWRWSVVGGGAAEFEESQNRFGLVGGGLSYFIIENLSLELGLNLLYFDQTDDAWGANFTLLGRWHFLTDDRWTIYVDGGAGVMGTTDRVPSPDFREPRGGGNFTFTPQAGVGFSHELDNDARFLLGVRWHHISNARIRDSNPPRDSFFIYAEVSFPF